MTILYFIAFIAASVYWFNPGGRGGVKTEMKINDTEKYSLGDAQKNFKQEYGRKKKLLRDLYLN